jgi:hypothetical protein
VVPALFLLVRPWRRPRAAGADPRAAGFVCASATIFALETIADPLAILRLGVPMLPFVLLGDFRVFLLVLTVAEPDRPLAGTIVRATGWTMMVPFVAWGTYRVALTAAGPLDEQVLWLVYEVAFVALMLWWRQRRLPDRRPIALRYLRAVVAYVRMRERELRIGRQALREDDERVLGAAGPGARSALGGSGRGPCRAAARRAPAAHRRWPASSRAPHRIFPGSCFWVFMTWK